MHLHSSVEGFWTLSFCCDSWSVWEYNKLQIDISFTFLLLWCAFNTSSINLSVIKTYIDTMSLEQEWKYNYFFIKLLQPQLLCLPCAFFFKQVDLPKTQALRLKERNDWTEWMDDIPQMHNHMIKKADVCWCYLKRVCFRQWSLTNHDLEKEKKSVNWCYSLTYLHLSKK